MSIENTTLTGTPTAIFTSVGGSNAVVSTYFCNPTAADIEFSVYAVPVGASADDTTVIYHNINATTTDTYVLDTEKLLLSPGEALFANGAGVVATVIYTKI